MSDKLFVGLHNHSYYSLQDSISSPDDMARKAKELGMNALAISEHGTLASWLQFRDACKKYGIKSIFGLESYFVDDVKEVYKANDQIVKLQEVVDELKKEKKPNKQEKLQLQKAQERVQETQEIRNKLKKYNHLILLAKNWEGCQNLIKIHNDSVIDGIYYKPRIDWAVLEKHQGGIIATTACLGGRISKLLEVNNIKGASEAVARFKKIFGPDNFYLELQLHDIKLQTETNLKIIKLSEATNTPMVITCDSHYIDEGQHTTRGLIRQLDKDPDEINNDDQLTDLFIKNEDLLLKAWRKYMPGTDAKYLAEAILNTRKIADMVEQYPFDTSLKFPVFQAGDMTQEDFLSKAAWEGLKRKGLDNKPDYVKRLQLELDTVNPLGFASYFNIVADIISEAKKHQPVGIGRGCLVGNSTVWTSEGKKYLKHIKINDMVYDHLGKLQIVENTMQYKIDEKLIQINAAYLNPVIMTLDHKIWASSSKIISENPKEKKYHDDINFEWIEAKKIKRGDWVFVPKLSREIKTIYSFDLAFFSEPSSIKNQTDITEYANANQHSKVNCSQKKHMRTISRFIRNDEEFCYWLGRFTGDGWLRKNAQAVFGIAFHSDDIDGIEKFKSFILKHNLEYSVNNSKTKKLTQINVNSKTWVNFIKYLFPKYSMNAQTKHCPEFIKSSPENLIISFLRGYKDADGHLDSARIRFTTVSKILANDLEYLYRSLGIPSYVSNKYRDYKHLNLFNKEVFIIDVPVKTKGRSFKILNSGYITRVNELIELPTEDVYDITVSNSHSYLSEFAVHNSVGGSLLAYVTDISSVDPIDAELYFERFLDKSKGVIPPTFGLGNEIIKAEIDYNKLLHEIEHDHDNCACQQEH
jgi:intein/homing endonuclease